MGYVPISGTLFCGLLGVLSAGPLHLIRGQALSGEYVEGNRIRDEGR